MTRIAPGLLLAFALLTGCAEDPCASALDPAGEAGGSSLFIKLVEQDGTIASKRRPLQCVDALVVRRDDYADTLAAGLFRIDGESLTLHGLEPGTADLVLDLPGYFPTKFTDLTLDPGANTLTDKVLMIPTKTAAALPGHLGVTLRNEYRLASVRNHYQPYGKVRVREAPGNHFELRLPWRGARGTRNDVERLLGRLVRSPEVVSARPLVEFSAVVRSF